MKNFSLASLAAIGLCSAILTGAPAHAQALIADASTEDVKSLITGIGGTVVNAGVASSGRRYVRATSAEGLSFDIYSFQCDNDQADQRCTGLEFMVNFDLGSEDNVKKAMTLVDYAAVEDLGSGDNLTLSRYMILDGGISRSNFDTNLKVFLKISDNVWNLLTEKELFKD